MKVYILDYLRSPQSCFMSNLSTEKLTNISTKIIKSLLNKNKLEENEINQCIVGNVLSSGLGQNISKQISYEAGINCPSKTVNRVCSSGMTAIIEAYRMIKLEEADCVLVGGVELMSQAPFINKNVRNGSKYGHIELKDSMLLDGLTDPFSNKHMGLIAENINFKYKISREEQDNYTKLSYKKAIENSDLRKREINPLEIKNRKETIIIDNDEQINKINFDKLSLLKPVFEKDGTITAGNASPLSDGLSFMIVVSEKFINEKGLKCNIEIVNYEETSGEPTDFPILPVKSIIKLLEKNKLKKEEIDIFEINEAFSSVPILVNKELGIAFEKMNLYGGAVSLGHPLGCSGNRITGTLSNILKNTKKEYGIASICNGSGGATSILIKNIN